MGYDTQLVLPKRKNIFRALLLGATASLAILLLSVSRTAHAVDTHNWQAGRIIDDAIFFNSTNYSADQVQAFLDAKMPSCDTNGSQPYKNTGLTRAQWAAANGKPAPPYTCLKSFTTTFDTIAGDEYCPGGLVGGTKSVAQIITEVSLNCGISPKVVMVTLQKEQALITDDWPWNIQYDRAMGFSCYDNPFWCDPAYAGFAKQMYYGARQMKRYAQRPDLFPNYRPGRTSRIYFNPNSGCGYSDVYVENQATSNLYIYTPYQPNQATLDAPAGTVVNCGAYGNLNFWRTFHDWFGPTVGPLVRTLDSSTLYYSDGTRKYSVPSMEMANQYKLTVNDVRFISQQELDAIPTASVGLSQIVKSDDDSDDDGGALYLVSDGIRYQFSSMAQFFDFGFSESEIASMPIGSLYRLPKQSGFLSSFVQAPNLFVYKMESGKKRGIFEPAKLSQLNPSMQVTPLNNFTLGPFAVGDPYIDNDVTLRNGDDFWFFQEGNWYAIPSMRVHGCWNFGNVTNFSIDASKAVPKSGKSLSCVAKKSDNSLFLMNRVNKISSTAPWGLANPSASPLDRTIDRLGSVSVASGSAFRSSANSNIYILEGGKKRLLATMDTLSGLGLNIANVVTVDPDLITTIPSGTTKLAPGQLVRDTQNRFYVIGDSNNRHYIPTPSVFNDLGHSYSSAINVSEQTLGAYPLSGDISRLFKVGSQAYLTSNDTGWKIGSSDETHYGISGGSPSYSANFLGQLAGTQNATRFVKSDNPNKTTVYYLESGSKRPVSSWGQLVSLGGENSIIQLSDSSLALFPDGPTI